MYDRTRALSERAQREVVSLLGAELRDRQPCLEVGVGTGRMALPLYESGVEIAGIDLSEEMMAKLVDKSGGRAPFPLVVGDAVALPFRDESFGAGLVCHVLHLINHWPAALLELVRVVRPGGVILIDWGGWGRGWSREITDRFCKEAGVRLPFPLNEGEPPRIGQIMRSLGTRARDLPPVQDVQTGTVATQIERLRSAIYSFTWGLGEEERRRAAEAVLPWAKERFGDLDEARRMEREVTWHAFDVL